MSKSEKKIIFFDLDGTLMPNNSWHLFNMHFGLTEKEDTTFYDLYHRGIIDFKEWVDLILRIIKERKRCTKEAYDAFCSTLAPRADALDLISECHLKGYTTIILSGAFHQSAEVIAKQIGVDHVYTTTLLAFDAQGMVSAVEFHKSMNENPVRNITDEGLAKLSIFKEVCASYGVDPKETIHVGDGSNDIEICKFSNKCIAIGNHPILGPLAWKRIINLNEVINFL